MATGLTIFGDGKFRDESNETEVSPQKRCSLSKPCEMQDSTSILNAYDQSGRTATQSWLIVISENLANTILRDLFVLKTMGGKDSSCDFEVSR
jgi:hypothetical protein